MKLKFALCWALLSLTRSAVGYAIAIDVPANPPKNLRDAYAAALIRSESLAIQKELLVQTNEVDSQAAGALLPTLSGSYNHLRQATPSSSTGNNIFPPSQTTAKITVIQPLFRGLRDFAALRQKKYLVGSQFQNLQNAARQLFYDVSTAYYNVVSLEQDEKNYLIQIGVNKKRLEELNSFVKIGRSQLTDVLTFKANIASLEAQLEVTRGQLESSKDILAYLTGWSRETPVKDNEQLPSTTRDIASYLANLENRADVKAAISNVEANDENVPIAFGQHFPSLDLLGNYYLARPGVISDVNWDIQFALTVPIFQGGIVQSQVRQAQAISRQYKLLLSQVRREAEREVRTFYDLVNADLKQVSKLSELVEISRKNADTQIKFYRNGLVTNLDVLQALTTHQDAKRQLDHQIAVAKLDSVKLEASAGQRPEINVKDSGKP